LQADEGRLKIEAPGNLNFAYFVYFVNGSTVNGQQSIMQLSLVFVAVVAALTSAVSAQQAGYAQVRARDSLACKTLRLDSVEGITGRVELRVKMDGIARS
jgi:hypothetical protein